MKPQGSCGDFESRSVRGAEGAGQRRSKRMRESVVTGVLVWVLTLVPAAPGWESDPYSVSDCLARAASFLGDRLDQYHKVFYVYKDRNAGGNHFVPSGWCGDIGDLRLDEGCTNTPAEGTSCIEINYSAACSQSNGWAAIYWQSMDGNWGDKGPGYDLSGATCLRFRARGKSGAERAIFRVGGINRPPYRNGQFAYMDSCEAVSIGPVALTTNWTELVVDLAAPGNFSVYSDYLASANHFAPSAWYNGSEGMSVDEACTESPYSGPTCVKITWNGQAGADTYEWNGCGWEWPEGRIARAEETLQGYDLTGASNLSFMVRAGEPGLQLKFVFGHPMDSSGEIGSPDGDLDGFVPIPTNWTRITIPVPEGVAMTNITLGFGVFYNSWNDPGEPGLSFYLDDIQYARPLRADLAGVIGGLCAALDTHMNPGGCTIYLDDIRYDKQRLDEPRMIQSYVVMDGPDEHILANYASTYDNALAGIAFALAGDANSVARARCIADAFLQAMGNDREFADGRLRNAYRSGDHLDPFTGKALLHGWWDPPLQRWCEDREAVGTSVGNMAWAGFGLLRIHRTTGETNYLEGAKRLGAWIVANTWDLRGAGGFTGGSYGWPGGAPGDNGWYTWKSSEHNIDAWQFFESLWRRTGDPAWSNAALHARTFVQSMWNEEQGFFHVGTTDDGVTVNTNVLVLDANTLGVLAFHNDIGQYERALLWVEANCRTADGGFEGFDFNSDRDGVWPEGTMQMALALLSRGQTGGAEGLLRGIRRAQRMAPNGDGRGIVAASRDHLTTGISWSYHRRLHVGATCWYMLAETGYNVFADRAILRIRELAREAPGFTLAWTSIPGVTCVVERCESPDGAWSARSEVVTGQWETRWTDPDEPGPRRFYRLATQGE